MNRHANLGVTLALLLASSACGGGTSADGGTDGSTMDSAMPVDSAMPDAGMDAATDSGVADSGMDTSVADSGIADTGVADSGTPDAGFVIPASCTATSECGPSASCVTGHCVCSASALPCGTTCCPLTYVRDLTLATGGHAPEIGFDAAGNVSVLYMVGSSSVRMATLPAGATSATTEVVAASSGNQDDADLAVAPDGTLLIAVHQPGAGRSGSFTLLTRAPAASTFTTSSLRPGLPDVFAFDSAVSISRAPGGDLYAGASARSGDGTLGLAMARYEATTGAWLNLPTLITASAYSRSELFARDDGFFVGVHDFPNDRDYYEDFGTGGGAPRYLAGAVAVSTYGQSAAAMGDDGVLTMFTGSTSAGRLDRSDGGLGESVVFSGFSGGAHSDIDMALDRDGNPALLVHSSTHNTVSLLVRMPTGGYTRYSWSDAFFLPATTPSSWMTLDMERLPNGNLAIVIGDSMDRGELHYQEIGR